jgi:hypothetical protein
MFAARNFATLSMPKTLQLTFTPTENADAILVNKRFCEAAGMTGASVVWRKRSLDARGKQPFFIITADVYGDGELPPVAQGFLARDVHSAMPVHIIGSGPAGLFAALSLIEQGFKPIVLERGKAVKERRRDLAVLNKEHAVDEDTITALGKVEPEPTAMANCIPAAPSGVMWPKFCRNWCIMAPPVLSHGRHIRTSAPINCPVS